MKCVTSVLICILYQFFITECRISSSESTSFEGAVYATSMENINAKMNKPDPQYEAERAAGSMSDLFGANQHYSNPSEYTDFGRRFMNQYSSNENGKILRFSQNNELVPEKASPEIVLALAQQSAILEGSKVVNTMDDFIKSKILRSGNYWNAVWKEEVDPNTLRISKNHYLESVKTRIIPGTKLYQLVSALKIISPRFLYVESSKFEVAPEFRFINYPPLVFKLPRQLVRTKIKNPTKRIKL